MTFSLNAAFFARQAADVIAFAIQHGGIAQYANVEKYIGLLVIVPLIIVGVVPMLNGRVNYANFTHLVQTAKVNQTPVIAT